jgi:hypothetical protein
VLAGPLRAASVVASAIVIIGFALFLARWARGLG